MNRILIAEDEPRLASFLEKGLRANGFTTTVIGDGVTAAVMARDEKFDLLILDLGLPGKDGTRVLHELRSADQHMPVLILTARDDVSDKVAGLEGGADDYMTKPFRFEELLARVRARLRDERSVEPTVLRSGEVTLDLRTRRASVDGRTTELTAREFTMLEVLLRHAGQVLSREQLLSHVWATTTTRAPTWSTCTSDTCARSSARTPSRRCAGWATGSRPKRLRRAPAAVPAPAAGRPGRVRRGRARARRRPARPADGPRGRTRGRAAPRR